jgi:hypothetical protein
MLPHPVEVTHQQTGRYLGLLPLLTKERSADDAIFRVAAAKCRWSVPGAECGLYQKDVQLQVATSASFHPIHLDAIPENLCSLAYW